MAIKLYMDVHIPKAITIGLRLRNVDVITAQEDGACGKTQIYSFNKKHLSIIFLIAVLITPTISLADADKIFKHIKQRRF